MKQYLSIPFQVPQHVRANYPAYVEFIQAYYKWFEEQYSLGKYSDLVDLDNTIDDFLQYFKKQLDVYGVTATTDRTYIRHIKELYTAKGSELGVDFLFKILYNTQSTTFEPWDTVFKPSDAKWISPVSVFVSNVVGDVFLLPNDRVTFTDIDGGKYTTFAGDVVQTIFYGPPVYEVFVTRFQPATKLASFQSENNNISGLVL